MPFGTAEQGFGALLGGVLQGLEQAKGKQQELQHRKDLLKLEQDKLKLIEKEQELTASGKAASEQTELYKALLQAQEGKVAGPNIWTPTQGWLTPPQTGFEKLGPGEVILPREAIPQQGFAAPMTPQQKGVGAVTPNREIEVAERLAKEANIPIGQAILTLAGKDEATQRRQLLQILAGLMIMSGRPAELDRVEAAVNRIMGGPVKDNYEVGKVYTDASGNKATYLGDGKWQMVK